MHVDQLHCQGSALIRGQQGVASAADPVPVGSFAGGLRQVAVDGDTGCAITAAGELYCWGDDRHGQLALGASATLYDCDGVGCAWSPRQLSFDESDFVANGTVADAREMIDPQ